MGFQLIPHTNLAPRPFLPSRLLLSPSTKRLNAVTDCIPPGQDLLWPLLPCCKAWPSLTVQHKDHAAGHGLKDVGFCCLQMFSGTCFELRSLGFAWMFVAPHPQEPAVAQERVVLPPGSSAPKSLFRAMYSRTGRKIGRSRGSITRENMRDFPWNNPFHGEGFEQL